MRGLGMCIPDTCSDDDAIILLKQGSHNDVSTT